jgi:hypothetical protein
VATSDKIIIKKFLSAGKIIAAKIIRGMLLEDLLSEFH